MHKRFQADCVIFDLDGTLVDTAPDLTHALNHVLAGLARPSVTPESVRSMVGRGAKAMIVHGIAATGDPLPENEIDDLFVEYLSYYRAHIADESQTFPGVRRYLSFLRKAGLPIGICTNKTEALAIELLKALDLTNYFDAVLGSDSLAIKKPDPGHLNGTMAQMGSGLSRALLIGDSEVDLEAARNAGMPVALVDFGYCGVPVASLGPDAVISSFEDLL